MVIDANRRTINEVVNDILLDWEIYVGKHISIQNVLFDRFGIESNPNRYSPTPDSHPLTIWLRNTETYCLVENPRNQVQRSNSFIFWYNPADREGRQFILNILGKYYTNPRTLTLNGRYIRLRDWVVTTYNPFIITSFIVNGVEYKGNIPIF